MASLAVCCLHSPTEVEGENVCRECGAVLGYSEVESVTSWQSHDVKLFNSNGMAWTVFQLANKLNLPQYAAQTILKTSVKLNKVGITKRKAIFFATIYSCRIHKIPRLLVDIFSELEKSTGKSTTQTETTLLKLINRIAKKLPNSEISILPPDKEYYLQAYLAKIQKIIVTEAGTKYFELIRTRAVKNLSLEKSDPSTAARNAILSCMSTILQAKIRSLI
ncbi:MAG: hypothetical protein ACT4OD_06660 [Candidatus Nitrosotenuis sp.]